MENTKTPLLILRDSKCYLVGVWKTHLSYVTTFNFIFFLCSLPFSFKLSPSSLSLNLFRDKDAKVQPVLWSNLITVLWNIYSMSTSPSRCNNSLNQLGAQKVILTQGTCVSFVVSLNGLIRKKSEVSRWRITLRAGLNEWEILLQNFYLHIQPQWFSLKELQM